MMQARNAKWIQVNKAAAIQKKRPSFWRRTGRSIRKRINYLEARIGFDRNWYLMEYPDVLLAGVNPVHHFIEFGKKENRFKSQRHKDQKEWWRIIQSIFDVCFSVAVFKRDWYLENYPDVAKAGEDPWWHYIKKGRYEGRFRCQKDKKKFYLKEPAEATAIFLGNEEAKHSADYGLISKYASTTNESGASSSIVDIEVFVSSLGNYFFRELAELLVAGLLEAGISCRLRTEQEGATILAKKHLVIAPHEFFFLGNGKFCFGPTFQGRLILLNTEQIHTRWFGLASQTFSLAEHILDINANNVHELRSRGISATYFQFGFVKKFDLYDGSRPLAFGARTEALSEPIRVWKDLNYPLAERPLDLCFFGEATARRCQLLADMAPILQRFECYLFLKQAALGAQIINHDSEYSNTRLSVGIARRSKIMLNLHRSNENYFEWHRIVMMGLWQRALVITEPVENASPFQAGRDFVEVPAGEIGSRLKYYLLDPRGTLEAERIRNQGHRTLQEYCEFAPHLRHILNALSAHDLKG
jgi:hypothetical protein